MTLYKIQFGQKYYNYTNSFIIIKEATSKLIRFIDKQIKNIIDTNLPTINKVIKKYVKYKAYKEDGKNMKKKLKKKIKKKIIKKMAKR